MANENHGVLYWIAFAYLFRFWWNYWEKDLGREAYEGHRPPPAPDLRCR